MTGLKLRKKWKSCLPEDRELYESPEKKQQLLRQYTEKCAHDISGKTIVIRLDQLSRNLDEKADWMMENIRRRAMGKRRRKRLVQRIL